MTSFSVGLAASLWIVLLVIAAGFAFAVYTYRTTAPAVAPARRWTLITLRTLGLALLLLTLFEPVLSLLNINAEPPVVVVAVDNSRSMTLGGQDSSRIAEAWAIARRLEGSKLGATARFVVVADSVRPLGHPLARAAFNANGPESRLEAVFASAADSLRLHNVRAVVMLSDGRYNVGANPLQSAEGLGMPVFTVGLGDSVPPRDLVVDELFTNEIAYVGSELPVEVRAKSTGFDNGTATITLRDDNRVVGTQSVTLAPGSNEYTASFTYTPRAEGIAKLRAEISPRPGELTDRNNARITYVRVKSNKRRYVLIAGSPSPDVAFIRRLLSNEPNVEVRTFIGRTGADFIEGKPDARAFADAEAVVLIDYPTTGASAETVNLIRTSVRAGNLPLFVVLGANTDAARLKELEELLPVTVGASRRDEMQVSAEITENGRANPVTRIRHPEAWAQMPPIYRTETTLRAKPESEVLARARLGGALLDEPLIVSRRLGRSRSLIVTGYGIYRWQLLGEGPAAARGAEPGGVLEDFVANSVRWLAVADEQKQVRIAASKQLYSLGEAVRIQAQVYNESFEPVNDAEVTVAIKGPARTVNLVLAAIGNGRYEATVSGLGAGDYSFTGRAVSGGRELGRDGGRFAIDEVGIEFQEPSMNAELLRELASRTGGKFYTARTSNTLVDDIVNHKGFSPRSVESRNDLPLRHLPWLLAAALAAFSVEWFIRKRSGML